MRYRTRQLGAVEVAKDAILFFVAPLLGFESFRKFALLPVPGAKPFFWLQSLEEPQLAFPVVAASEVGATYPMPTDDLRRVAAASADEVSCWIVVALPAAAPRSRQASGGKFRLNLRAPIVVNAHQQLAAQIVVGDEYSIVRTTRVGKESFSARRNETKEESAVVAGSA
jgi:flagellar assembly factor FliW